MRQVYYYLRMGCQGAREEGNLPDTRSHSALFRKQYSQDGNSRRKGVHKSHSGIRMQFSRNRSRQGVGDINFCCPSGIWQV